MEIRLFFRNVEFCSVILSLLHAFSHCLLQVTTLVFFLSTINHLQIEKAINYVFFFFLFYECVHANIFFHSVSGINKGRP